MLASRVPQFELWNLVEAVLFLLSHAVLKSEVFPWLWLLLLLDSTKLPSKVVFKGLRTPRDLIVPSLWRFRSRRKNVWTRKVLKSGSANVCRVFLPMKSSSWYGIPSEATSPNKWRVSFVVDHWCCSNTRRADSSSSTTWSLPEQAIQRECQMKVLNLTRQQPIWIHARRKEETFNSPHASSLDQGEFGWNSKFVAFHTHSMEQKMMPFVLKRWRHTRSPGRWSTRQNC